MRTSISAALLTAAVTVIPAGSVLAASHSTVKHTAKRVATRTYVGPGVDMQWGTVQVTIVVTGKTVSDLKATAPTERARSAYINGIAVPMLRKEVLQAKTVAKIKNIYGISGATMTSEAFYQSLLATLKSAHLM
ncbi:MAG TPA: FMN-binding protein [Chloroflexota bacterium]|nr:FMN-binding protein [Chloroflexota bacterium]